MSTRGCIIELKKDVCKVGYLHYGANFASKLIHYGMLGLTFTEDVLKTDIEMEQKEGVVGVFYQETNDAGIIERLFRYDTSVINIDAEIFISVSYTHLTLPTNREG